MSFLRVKSNIFDKLICLNCVMLCLTTKNGIWQITCETTGMNNNLSYKILVVAATGAEGEALRKISGILQSGTGYRLGSSVITLLVTGTGQVATSWSLTKWLSCNEKPDLTVNIGIAGSYNDSLKIGEVVTPVSDCFADSGIETGNKIVTLAEAGMENPPFRDGKLYAENKYVKK